MSPTDLTKLPAELLVWVMTQLDTPRDLWSFVLSSKRHHQVFRQSQKTILPPVVRTAMLENNIQDAIVACSVLEALPRANTRPSASSTMGGSLPEIYGQAQLSSAELSMTLQDFDFVLRLCRLWWVTDNFIYRFEHAAMKFAVQNFHWVQKEGRRPITTLERSRLQRAFFRFETYRRLASISNKDAPPDLDVLEVWGDGHGRGHAACFLDQFPPWDREALLAIQEYLVAFAKQLIRNTMEYTVQEISGLASEVVANKPDTPLVMHPAQRLSRFLDFNCINVFLHGRSRTQRRFQGFVGRGLPFLRWLTSLPPNVKLHAILRYSHSCKSRFTLFEIVYDNCDRWDASDATRGWSSRIEKVACSNPGWTWADNRNLTVGESDLLRRYNLRRSGYVFWDEERLRDEWRFPETYEHELRLKSRKPHDDDTDWHRERHLTIWARFEDMKLPEHIFKSTRDGIFARLMPDGIWKTMIEEGTWPRSGSDKGAELFRFEY